MAKVQGLSGILAIFDHTSAMNGNAMMDGMVI